MAMVGSLGEEALSLQKNHRLHEAETIIRRLDEDLRRWLGAEHTRTAANFTRLAANLEIQGRLAEAQPLCQKALEIRLRVLGEDHPRTADAYDNLAVILTRQGRHRDAQPLFRRALRSAERPWVRTTLTLPRAMPIPRGS